MKKTKIHLATTAIFIILLLFIFFRHQAKEKNRESRAYYLLERNKLLAATDEWQQVSVQAKVLLQAIQDNPADVSSKISLATLYIRESRVTGNHAYYDQAAMNYVNEVLSQDENNFEALSLKALILLSEHHFHEAIAIAQKAISINPYNAFIYGTLTDGYVETGNYTAAVESLEKMMSIRPDMRSYSRVSYLREIHGDYPGAIDAMKLAVDAGAPGDEATAWTRVQLGQLYEKVSDMKAAEIQYFTTLRDRPKYAYAIAGLARTAVHQKQYDEAIRLYLQADSLVQDYSISEGLMEVYEMKGDTKNALSLSKKIAGEMSGMMKSESQEDNAGHYSDREIAHVYLKTGDLSGALVHAMAEYNRRPENIDVNETLAWVYYSRGEFQKALPYIKKAMRTGSRNPTLLCRAGLIFGRVGDTTSAKRLLEQALNDSPTISAGLKIEGERILATL